MHGLTVKRMCVYLAVAVVLAVPQASVAVDRTVTYTGEVYSQYAPTLLEATVTASDGAVGDVPVTFILKTLSGLTRIYGPVETNSAGVASALANIPSGVYMLTISALFGADPAVLSDPVAMLVRPPAYPPNAWGVISGGRVLVDDDDFRSRFVRCDPDREITFAIMAGRRLADGQDAGTLPGFSFSFLWIDPDGPIIPTCQLDPECQPVVIETRFYESMSCDCGEENGDEEEEPVICLRGKAVVNGVRGYPFELRFYQENGDVEVELVVTNPRDVNFQPYYSVVVEADDEIEDFYFRYRCPVDL